MAELIKFVCDGCGVTKGDANHWYKVRLGEAIHVYRWNFGGEGASDTNLETLHLCGHECVQKKLSEWMGERASVRIADAEAAV